MVNSFHEIIFASKDSKGYMHFLETGVRVFDLSQRDKKRVFTGKNNHVIQHGYLFHWITVSLCEEQFVYEWLRTSIALKNLLMSNREIAL